MRRSLQTAAPIGEAIGLQPEVWVDIHETGGVFLDYHEGRGLPGLKRAEMAAQFPTFRLSPEVTEDGWWNRGQESKEEWLERAARVAAELRERYATSDERIGLVTHGGFADKLLHTLFGHTMPPRVILPHRNTAITRLDFCDRNGMIVQYFNRVEHLPSALLSSSYPPLDLTPGPFPAGKRVIERGWPPYPARSAGMTGVRTRRLLADCYYGAPLAQ